MTDQDKRILASAQLKIEAKRIENGLPARREIIERALDTLEAKNHA